MKSVFLIMIILVIGFAGFFYFDQSKELNFSLEDHINIPVLSQDNSQNASFDNSLSEVEHNQLEDSSLRKRYGELTKQELLALNQKLDADNTLDWQASLGKSSELLELYSNYDEETLLSLAEQGDTIALFLAADGLHRKGYSLQAYNYRIKAAIRGSTPALTRISHQFKTDFRLLSEKKISETRVREKYQLPENVSVENYLFDAAFAYTVVAAMRGDIEHSKLTFNSIKERLLDRRLTQQEWAKIKQSAKQIYSNLETVRQDIGLNGFDNQYPLDYAWTYGLPDSNTDPFSLLEAEFVQ